jgi:hypothetical protein
MPSADAGNLEGRTVTDTLDDFWEASSLDQLRIGAFTARLLAYEHRPPGVHPYTPPGAPIALPPVCDRLQRLFGARRSERTFRSKPLRHKQIVRVLAATGPRPDGGRLIPEAGGLRTVHVYAMVHSGHGPLAGQVVRYDDRTHTATPLGPVPPDDRLCELFQLDEPPPLVLAFVVDLTAAAARYGPRAGRFVLQQTGHAAQNVSLRLAADGLRGYLLGGGLDHEVLQVLGLAHTDARYVSALACGR